MERASDTTALVQAGLLGGEVDQIAHNDIGIEIGAGKRDGGSGLLKVLGGAHGKLADVGQTADEVGHALDGLGDLGARGLDDHGQGLLGAQAIAGTGGAGVGHDGTGELEGTLGLLIDEALEGLGLGPGGDHEGLGALDTAVLVHIQPTGGHLIPNGLGDERHERVHVEGLGLGPGGDHEGLGALDTAVLVHIQPTGGHLIPNGLGDERHERVHAAHAGIEHEDQVALSLQAGGIVLEAGLGALDVPVADLIPEEVLDAARHLAKGVLLNTLSHHTRGLGQAAEHPGIGRGLGDGLTRGVAIHVHEQETAGVPDLGDKGAGLLGTGRTLEGLRLLIDVGVELDVLVGGAQREQVVAHGIGTVHVDEVHGVHTCR